MLTDENAVILKDWADEVRRLDAASAKTAEGRDLAIREALGDGAGVAEIVKATGLTRARIYQIKKKRKS